MLKKLVFTFILISNLLSGQVYAAEDVTFNGKILEAQNSVYKVDIKTSDGSTQQIEAKGLQTYEETKKDFKVGDNVVVTKIDVTNEYFVTDYQRQTPLVFLFLIFALMAALIGGIKGIRALIGLIFSYFIILNFILKNIVGGMNPILVAVFGALLIMFFTFYLSHGFNKKTTISVVGTFITLFITGIMSKIFIDWAHLSGFGTDASIFVQIASQNKLDMSSLLLAGVVISALGVLDDITTSQVSIVNELIETNPRISTSELFFRSMNVGRDHIASLVNTLFLVFTGGSLPLMLLFFDSSKTLSDMINYEPIAEEILITLVGSIGLILAVPITTLIAALTLKKTN